MLFPPWSSTPSRREKVFWLAIEIQMTIPIQLEWGALLFSSQYFNTPTTHTHTHITIIITHFQTPPTPPIPYTQWKAFKLELRCSCPSPSHPINGHNHIIGPIDKLYSNHHSFICNTITIFQLILLFTLVQQVEKCRIIIFHEYMLEDKDNRRIAPNLKLWLDYKSLSILVLLFM